ncbi:MAG: response regulator [Gammaproteobacteria bacterium]
MYNESTATSADEPPLRVLVIDDDPMTLQAVGRNLLAAGHKVYPVTSGEAGLEIAPRVAPDLILLDVSMPDMDGFETCRRLKRLRGFSHSPVIFLTSHHDEADVLKGFEVGGVDYLSKPVQRTELLARISTQANTWRFTRELERQVKARTAELEASNSKLRELAVQASLAEEYERQRIARGLHDEVIQNLALVRQQLGSKQAAERMAHMDPVETLDESIDLLRSLIFDLSPPMLYELGLGQALKALARNFSQSRGLPVTCRFAEDIPDIAEPLAVFAYQAARELLVNVSRHAKASSAVLSLVRRGERILLNVSDDGRGMQDVVPGPEQSHGFGLFSIRQRLQHLGGNMETSSGNKGTSITLSLPYQLD